MTTARTPPTYVPPAGRDSADELQRKRLLVQSSRLLQQTIDAIPDIVLILNGNRQVVGANRQLTEMLGCTLDQMLGKRLGEVVGCRNCTAGPDGCGTGPDCLLCGAAHAVLEGQQGERQVVRECRVVLAEPIGGALDLKVAATAIALDGDQLAICVLKDISSEKRLAVLSRMFFHDVMNTAGSIMGLTGVLLDEVPPTAPETPDLQQLAELSEQLVEEIQSQRDLTYAESGDLELSPGPVDTRTLLERLQASFSKHPVCSGRTIVLQEVWSGTVVSDARLLHRVLGNMLKNALEATEPQGTVTLSCVDEGERVTFRVHNASVMPEEVQRQVFQRSFSTKARMGRGIGTHSMKLLGERYLGGKVDFISRVPEGTTFFFALPKSPPPRPANPESAPI